MNKLIDCIKKKLKDWYDPKWKVDKGRNVFIVYSDMHWSAKMARQIVREFKESPLDTVIKFGTLFSFCIVIIGSLYGILRWVFVTICHIIANLC